MANAVHSHAGACFEITVLLRQPIDFRQHARLVSQDAVARVHPVGDQWVGAYRRRPGCREPDPQVPVLELMKGLVEAAELAKEVGSRDHVRRPRGNGVGREDASEQVAPGRLNELDYV